MPTAGRLSVAAVARIGIGAVIRSCTGRRAAVGVLFLIGGLAVWTVEHDLGAGERKSRQEPRASCRLAATSKPSPHRHAVDARRQFDRGYGGERQRDEYDLWRGRTGRTDDSAVE
jgi:hypothetical protein